MALLQDMLKESLQALNGDYGAAIKNVIDNLSAESIWGMNNKQYTLLNKPQIYQGSISADAANFAATELSLPLIEMDGSGNSFSISSPYNNWAKDKVLNLQDQYRNMYDYLTNIDPIEIGRNLSEDELDSVMDSVIQAKRNKTRVSNSYSGPGLDNAINFLNNDRGSTNTDTLKKRRRKGNKKRLYESDFTFESGYDIDDILNMDWEELGHEYYDPDWDPDSVFNNTTMEDLTGTTFNTVKVNESPIINRDTQATQTAQTINTESNVNAEPDPVLNSDTKTTINPEPDSIPEPDPTPDPNPIPDPDPTPESVPTPEVDNTKKVAPDLDGPKTKSEPKTKSKGTAFDTTEVKEAMEDTVEYVKETADDAKNAIKEFMDGKLMRTANIGLNAAFAIGDYKDFRRKGDGVITASLKAAGKFAIDEALGFYALPIELIKSAPSLAIQGAEMLYKENRKMNSAANQQVFGGSQFADNQQLATMRQSGMEMAKMAQYNLQQTLMGTEATHLHR